MRSERKKEIEKMRKIRERTETTWQGTYTDQFLEPCGTVF